MSEEDRSKNIDDEIEDTANIDDSLVEEASLEENTAEDISDTTQEYELPKETTGTIEDESSISTNTDDILTKVDADEAENEENIDSVINDISNDDVIGNSTENDVTINEVENAGYINENSNSNEPSLENAGFKDKLLLKIKTLPNTIKGLRTKISANNSKALIKVFKNPWIVANGLVLILALCMTFVMVSWFKLKTIKINDALNSLNNIEQKAKSKEKVLNDVKITVQPFIVDKGTLEKEGLHKVNEMKLKEDKFTSLLKSANELFEKKEYQKALVFYNALVSENGVEDDKSFFYFRIGECLYYSGLYKEAIEAFKTVLTVKAGSKKNIWRSKYLVAKSYIKLDKYDKGRRELYELMAKGADFPSEMNELMERSYFAIANSYFNEVHAEK